MIAIKKTSPYVRKETSTKRMMVDVLIALLPILIFAVYKYSFTYLLKAVVVSAVAVGAEALMILIMKRQKGVTLKQTFKNNYTINNIVPPIITALIFLFTLPATISYYVLIVGILFAIVIVKMLFGGLGQNFLNPAGAARIFVGLALASFFTYQNVDGLAGSTALGTAYPDVLNSYSLLDLFIGNIPGSSGEISKAAILLGGVYLLIRRSADYRPVVSSLAIFAVIIFFAGLGLGYGADSFRFTLYHLLSGGLLFGVFFMATDPVTSPYTRPGRLIFGFIIGALVAIIRLFGALPEGMVFALLIANVFVGLIDYKKWTTNVYTKRFAIGYAMMIVAVTFIVFVGVGGLR